MLRLTLHLFLQKLVSRFLDLEAAEDGAEEAELEFDDDDDIEGASSGLIPEHAYTRLLEFVQSDSETIDALDNGSSHRLLATIYRGADNEDARALATRYREMAREYGNIQSTEETMALVAQSAAGIVPQLVGEIVSEDWARVQRGRYTGALAYVEQVRDDIVSVWVPSRPRVRPPKTQSHTEKAGESATGNPVRSRRASHRASTDRNIRDGLVRLRYKVHKVSPLASAPQEEEIAPFNGVQWISPVAMERIIRRVYIASLAVYDRVRVVAGQLRGLSGMIQNIADGSAEVVVDRDLNPVQVVTVPLDHLERTFKIGDTVRVIRGVHRGSTGFIVTAGGHDVIVILMNDQSEVSL